MGFLNWLLRGLFGAPRPRGSWAGGSTVGTSPAREKLYATAEHDAERLATLGLPNIRDEQELADAIGIPLGVLHWLTYAERKRRDRREPRHYVACGLPKRSGGYRILYAPKARLKAVQRWILRNILDRVPAAPQAHGFVRGRSIRTNAGPHSHQAIVVKLDLQDFFPSITYRRVRGLFQALGYGDVVAICLAKLCTVRPAEKVVRFLGNIRHPMLPQGAPTSPAIANLVCRRLDARLGGLATAFGCTYTRYADDITFSGDEAFEKSLRRFLPLLYRVVKDENFRLNRNKTHFARRGARQGVTGLVVNDGPSVPRRYRRQLRAILHNARKTGLEAQNRAAHPAFAAHLRGRIEFVRATHPELADRLLAELDALR